MTFHPNQDLKGFKAAGTWRLILRDIAGALAVAVIVLGSSFAAGVIETLLRRYL